MFNRIFQRKPSESSAEEKDDLQEFFDEIDAKEREIADKKAKIKEEYLNGARITKHRFTV